MLVLLVTLISLMAPAQSLLGNQKCTTLVQEGINLLRQNKYNEALAKFQEAEKADPLASTPLSGRALAFYSASLVTVDENVKPYRQNAKNFAESAIERDRTDVIAQEVLRLLVEGQDKERHIPIKEAKSAFEAGEDLFQKKEYDAALDKYKRAFQLDPEYSEAFLYAGDCRFVQGKFQEAEEYFRKAVSIDPLHERAWRFLADAFLRQGKRLESRAALINAISARPNYGAAWDNMSDLAKASGEALKFFQIKPMAKAVVDEKTKQVNIVIDQEFLASEDKTTPSADLGAWVTYGLAQAAKGLPVKPGEPKKSPFEAELFAWEKALKVAGELEANAKRKLKNPALIQMRAFAASGDLKAALFLLKYREEYRPDFEGWKQANPHAIRDFLDKYSLRP